MTNHTEPDLGPLNWVKGEIDQALARASEAISQANSGAQPDRASQLQFAQNHLHQARGALSIVGLDGLAQFADGLDQYLGQCARGELSFGPEQAGLCRRALASIGNYLEEVSHGAPDQPLRLLPIHLALSEARGTPAVPADLFFPDLERRPPRRPPPAPLPADQLTNRIKALRARFQRGLLGWLKQPDPTVGASDMREAVAGIEAMQTLPANRGFWWASLALMDALARGQLGPDSAEAKRLATRIDGMLRRMPDAGAPPERLMREVLYQLAQLPPKSELQQLVRDTYGLDALVPTSAPISETPLGPLTRELRERLGKLRDSWTAFSEGTASALPEFDKHLKGLSETVPRLGRPQAERLMAVLTAFCGWLRRDPLKLNDAIAMEVATALLLAENLFGPAASGNLDAQVREAALRLEGLAKGQQPASAPPTAATDAARRTQEREALDQLQREILSNLGQVEQVLDTFFRHPDRRNELGTLDTPLSQVEGAMMVLGEQRALEELQAARRDIAGVIANPVAPERELCERIANRLSAVSLYIESLNAGGADLDRLLGIEPTEAPAEPVEEEEAAPEAEAELPPLPPAAPPPPAFKPVIIAAAPVPAQEAEIDEELLGIFIEEAHEVLETMASNLAISRSNPADKEVFTALRRGFHTLKGSGRMVGLNALGEAAWGLEQTLNRWLQMEWEPSPPLHGLIDRARAFFSDWVGVLERKEGLDPDASALLAQAECLRSLESPNDDAALARCDELATGKVADTVDAVAAAAVSAPIPALETTQVEAAPEEVALSEVASADIVGAEAESADAAITLEELAEPDSQADAGGLSLEMPPVSAATPSARDLSIELPAEEAEEIELSLDLDELPESAQGAGEDYPADALIETRLDLDLAALIGSGAGPRDLAEMDAGSEEPGAIESFSLEEPAPAPAFEPEAVAADDGQPPLQALPLTLEEEQTPAPLEATPLASQLPTEPEAGEEIVALDDGLQDIALAEDDLQATPLDVGGFEFPELSLSPSGEILPVGTRPDQTPISETLSVTEEDAAGEAAIELVQTSDGIDLHPLVADEFAALVEDFPDTLAPIATGEQERIAPLDEAPAPEEIDAAPPPADGLPEPFPDTLGEISLDLSDELTTLPADDEIVVDLGAEALEDETFAPLAEDFSTIVNDAGEAPQVLDLEASPGLDTLNFGDLDDTPATLEMVGTDALLPPPEAQVSALETDALAMEADDEFLSIDMLADEELEETALEEEIAPPVAEAPPSPPPPPPSPEADVVTLGDSAIPRPLYDLYLGEAQQHIATLRHELARLRTNPTLSPSELSVRAAHTLAGISGTARIPPVQVLAKALEHALERGHAGNHAPEAEQTDLLSTVADRLQAMVAEIGELRAPLPSPELVDQLDAVGRAPLLDPLPALDALLPEAHDEIATASFETASTQVPAEPPVPFITEQLAQATVDAPHAPVHLADAVIEKARVQDDIDEQLLPIFLEESGENLALISTALRAWRTEPDNPERGTAVARLLHTLKGSARMAGAMNLGEQVHGIESWLEQAREQAMPATELVDELETGLDQTRQMIAALAGGEAPEAAAALTSAAEPALDATAGAEASAGASLRVRADLVDRLVNEAGEIGIARTRIDGELRIVRRSLLDLTENVIRLRNQLRELEIQAEVQMRAHHVQVDANDDFDPLEMDRYTRLQELTRMMAESVGDVTTVQQNLLRNLDGAEAALSAQGRLTRELHQALMSVRMVPFISLADRLYRVVRQSAKDLAKKANLDIRGGNIEIDRSVLERMTAPLEHLLRNSVAHGIEAPETRRALGKPEIGQITLTVLQEGNEISIELADDGSGLNLERITARAREAGLIGRDEQPDEKRLANLIFVPGFSTAQTVSQVSGRGVGMDVVKSETAALGGRIDVSTYTGTGSAFRIHLPLTLAVTQALLVRAGGQHTYAIPSNMITQVMELKVDALERLRAEGGVHWQGAHYPYRYLPQLLGDSQAQPEYQRYNWVLLLRTGSETLALHVDGLRGNQEIVVKNAGQQLVRVVGISGATVLGDGAIVLILNPVALANRWSKTPVTAVVTGDIPADTGPARAPAVPTIMVVDDSLTVRKITSRLLEREGYRVVTAKDGVDAIEQLMETVPDAILSDIEMPRMDGFDLLRNLRADPRLTQVPVVMISSRTADKHREHARSLGATEYLGKPYQEDELLALLRSYTQGEVAPQ